jgi:hypothetical protein
MKPKKDKTAPAPAKSAAHSNLRSMDDSHRTGPRSLQQASGGRDGPTQQRDIVTERGTEPAGLEKVQLHINDHETGLRRDQIEGVGLRIDDRDL